MSASTPSRHRPSVIMATFLLALAPVAGSLSPAAAAATFTAVVVRTNDIARTAEIAGVASPGATVSAAGVSAPVEADGSYFLVAPLTGQGDRPSRLTIVETVDGSEVGHAELEATVVPGGTVSPVAVDSVELDRDAAVPVPVVVAHEEARAALSGRVTLVAPRGTRFAEAPATVPGRSRIGASGAWSEPRPELALVDPRLDADGSRLEYRLRAQPAVPAGEQHRYDVEIATVPDAPAGAAALTYTYEGVSSVGDFRAAGDTPVDVPAERLEFAITTPDSAQLAAGYTPGAPFTFRGTGRSSAPIRVENAKGLLLGEVTVTEQGEWSWRRADMGTYVWSLVILQDAGTPQVQRRFVTAFAPADEPPAPSDPVVVTSPGEPRQGYVVGAAYPFAGTSRPAAPIEIRTSTGIVLHETQADTTGRWTWLATELGSARWTLVVVADPGTARERRAEIRDFAPSASDILVTAPTTLDLVAGYEPARPFTFRGVVVPGSSVTVRNAKGLDLGEATVDESGLWSWTRDNMGYYTWYLRFIRDEGGPSSDEARVEAFGPRL